jgi:S-DNA-T family DNA segregation ATPase FtsK/SpoIIIE
VARKSSNSRARNKRAQTAKTNRRAASPAEKQSRRKPAPERVVEDDSRVINERQRRDIAGIVCAVLALALFAIVVIPANTPVASNLSYMLHQGFGLGAYILPVLLIAIGVSFFIYHQNTTVTTRMAIGLTMIYFALLVIFALFTPSNFGDSAVPATLFSPFQLESHGGYIGAGIAWVLLSLFGQVVSVIIMVGVILAGLVIIGFSASKGLEKIREKKRIEAEQEAGLNHVFDQEIQRSVRPGRVGSQTKLMNQHGTRPSSPTPSNGETRALTRKLGQNSGDHDRTHRIKPEGEKTRKLGTPPVVVPAVKTPQTSDSKGKEDEEGFKLPPFTILKTSKSKKHSKTFESNLAQTAAHLQETLEDFHIMAQVVDWVVGPSVTLFSVELPSGVRVSRVINLEQDIALALAAPGVRIFAPIPGTNYVGIEVPNSQRENVLLGDVLPSAHEGPLEIAIGKDVEGNKIVCDLAMMPHLLIGGTTGSGKTKAIHSMIVSILMRATPDQVLFIMIDPKRVELNKYKDIPHLYTPVVMEPKEAASALSWGVAEMERRLKLFSKSNASNISQYNAKVSNGQLEDENAQELPYIVIVIDELADLMMNMGKEVEFSISRIAQLARAAGIHLIVATQRPSANIVTGLIKANITTRIGMTVASGMDSRVILDTTGAERLTGKGDLLLSQPEYPEPRRIQGCFITDEEINEVADYLRTQAEPDYHNEILDQKNLITLGSSQPDGSGGSVGDDDPLVWEAAEIVVSTGIGSTSNLQRRLKVGYSRAGRIMDMLEEKGIVGPQNGSKPREVLVDEMELETLKAFEANDEA